MLHATLYEPQCVPPLPDLMLLDEEEEPCAEAWGVGLASFAPASCGGGSAPVPIVVRAPRAVPAGPASYVGADFVDSMESTQTLLGASLAEAGPGSAAASYGASHGAGPMRFVPVPLAPAPPPPPPPATRALYLQPQPQQPRGVGGAEAYGGSATATDALLFDGYGVVAEPQALPFPGAHPGQHSADAYQYHHGRRLAAPPAAHHEPLSRHQHPPRRHGSNAGASDGWDLAHGGGSGGEPSSGIAAADMAYPFSARFGAQLPQVRLLLHVRACTPLGLHVQPAGVPGPRCAAIWRAISHPHSLPLISAVPRPAPTLPAVHRPPTTRPPACLRMYWSLATTEAVPTRRIGRYCRAATLAGTAAATTAVRARATWVAASATAWAPR